MLPVTTIPGRELSMPVEDRIRELRQAVECKPTTVTMDVDHWRGQSVAYSNLPVIGACPS